MDQNMKDKFREDISGIFDDDFKNMSDEISKVFTEAATVILEGKAMGQYIDDLSLSSDGFITLMCILAEYWCVANNEDTLKIVESIMSRVTLCNKKIKEINENDEDK